jgi:hypothetical protein
MSKLAHVLKFLIAAGAQERIAVQVYLLLWLLLLLQLLMLCSC